MTVNSIKEAWEMVDEIFPTDYTENTVKSQNAGYKIYDSNLGDEKGYICDLGNRLEVNLESGKTINIWIDEQPKMKTFEQLEINEKREITTLIANWLQVYAQEVIVKVLAKRDEIISNEFAVNLLKELKAREETEQKDFADSIGWLLRNYDEHKEYNPHNHVLTHAKSYRDVLYDMYIKN